MKNRAKAQLFLYSLLHFCVDWACILLVTGSVRLGIYDHAGWLVCLLIYNGAAFALQLPLGVLLDALGRERGPVWLGCCLVALAWLLQSLGLWRCLIAGVGNALFHLGAGSRVLADSDGRAGPSGVFVSTGAVGVWLGAWCARQGLAGSVLPVAIMLTGALAALLFSLSHRDQAPGSVGEPPLNKKRILGCFLLFFTVCLRAWAGGLMAYPWQQGAWALAAVLCIAAGKALGGLLGDCFGFGSCAAVTLVSAAALFLFAPALPAAGLLAALLFNTSMALTLTALSNALGPAHRGLAFGLTTFALFWGTAPQMLRLPGTGSGTLLCAIALASAGLMVLGLRWARSGEGKP